jgi:hypothetical protein
MNNNLFKIDDSEKMRILEMHQSATSRHYLGEQVAPATTVAAPATTTTTPVTTTKSPSMAPMSISQINIKNGGNFKLMLNGKPLNFNAQFSPSIDKNKQPLPGNFRITVKPEGMVNFYYVLNYQCNNPTIVTHTGLNLIPKVDQLTGITAEYNDRTFSNPDPSKPIDKNRPNLENLLSQLKQAEWDISSFGDLSSLCPKS